MIGKNKISIRTRKKNSPLWKGMLLSAAIHCAVLLPLSREKVTELPARKGNVSFINFSLLGEDNSSFSREPAKETTGDRQRKFSNTGEGWVFGKLMQKENRREKADDEKRIIASSVSAEELQLINNYETAVKQLIEKNKYYPSFSRRTGQQGEVTVRFTVALDGSLVGDVLLIKSCRYDLLNRAGIETIRSIESFPSIPRELQMTEMTFTIDITFSLREYVMRGGDSDSRQAFMATY